MKRLSYLAVLMVLSSSAQAGTWYSLGIGRHRIRIDARHVCGSLSCVSWSIPGIHGIGHRRDRDEDIAAKSDTAPTRALCAATQPAPVLAPAPAVVQAQPIPAPLSVQPAAAPLSQAQPPQAAPATTIELAATTTQSVPPPTPKADSEKSVTDEQPVVEAPAVTVKPAAGAAPRPPEATNEAEPISDTPLGDWQTEGSKGVVRIEQCGSELCGYLLNASTGAKGETLLSNMKPKNDRTDSQWSGDIYSRATGNSYHARMTLKQPNLLRVEACALGPFFCSGNDWTRVVTRKDELMMSREGSAEPRS